MTLIVEDGSLMAGANTYASLDTIKDFALNRGVTLGSDSQIEVWNASAIDYLEGRRCEYEGQKVAQIQSLQFPRTGLVIDGFDFPSTAIPKELVSANCQLIIEQSLGIVLRPTQDGAVVKSETIGLIKTDYAVSVGSHPMPVMPAVEDLLAPLLKRACTGSGFSFMRV